MSVAMNSFKGIRNNWSRFVFCKNAMRIVNVALVALIGLAALLPQIANAQSKKLDEQHAVLAKYLDADIDAVAWADFGSMTDEEWKKIGEWLPDDGILDAGRERIQQAGIEKVYILVRLPEFIPFGIGFRGIVLSKDPQAAIRLMADDPDLPGAKFVVDGNAVLVGMSDQALQSFRKKDGEPDPELLEAIILCRGKHGLAFAPDKTILQATLAMARPTSGEYQKLFDSMAGFRLASVWQDPDSLEPRLNVLFRDETLAAGFAESANHELTKAFEGSPEIGELLQAESQTVSLKNPASLFALTASIRIQARQAQVLNNFRQVALAMHNFESAYKCFPPQSLTNERGERLLSWRVMMLQYLGEMELYEQFHLDEPWDSPHNLPLASQMPRVFASDDPELAADQLKRGVTCMVVPLTKDSFFGRPGPSLSFPDLKDGTSKTLMVVEVNSEHAVPWTKPEDVEFDPANPLAKVARRAGGKFVAAMMDGSVRLLSSDMPAETMNALLTIDGGEKVDFEKATKDR